MNEVSSIEIIFWAVMIIIILAMLRVFGWIFDREEQPKEKVDDENDFNHRTG